MARKRITEADLSRRIYGISAVDALVHIWGGFSRAALELRREGLSDMTPSVLRRILDGELVTEKELRTMHGMIKVEDLE